MSENEKFCPNCKRNIPSDNYEIHFIHCQRNIQLCPACKEPVPRCDMEKHNSESHTMIKCSECRCEVEGLAMDDHKANHCSKRVIPCHYCDLEVKANALSEHENYCGSRTDDCEECGKIIMLKFWKHHLNSNHRLTHPNDNSSSESDDNLGTCEEKVHNDYPSRFCKNSLSRNRENHHFHRSVPYGNNSRKNQTRNSHFVHELDEYFGNMGIEKVRFRGSLDATGLMTDRAGTSHQEEPTFLPCEFCGAAIIADDLVLHQTGCRPDLVSHKAESNDPKPTWVQQVRQDIVHEISDDDDDDDDDVQYIDNRLDDEVLIPCEFCDRQFSVSSFVYHQITCGGNDGPASRIQD